MMNDYISFNWDGYSTDVSKYFQTLKQDSLFTDVTLVSDDQVQVSAHKVVLSLCSGYFKNILTKNIHPHPLLCLDGVSSEELNNVVDYIYNGQVKIGQNKIDRFLALAQKLQLQGLLNDDRKFDVIQDEFERNECSTQATTPTSLQRQESFKDVINHDHEGVITSQEENIGEIKRRKSKKFKNIILHPESDMTIEELDYKVTKNIEKISGDGYKCIICGKTFGRGGARFHVETHFKKLFYCIECEKTSTNRRSLYQHFCAGQN